jgi:hypothetical protein
VFQQLLSILGAQPVLEKQKAGYHSGENVAEQHDTHARNTLPHQKLVKAKTHGGHNNYEKEDRKNVPLVRFQHGTGKNLG